MKRLLTMTVCGWLAACVAAEDGFPSIEFRGLIDARLVAADAERTWLDGEFGKTRYGAGESSTDLRLAEASLIALPRFGWSTSGYLHLKTDPEQVHALDIVEGYLAWAPVSTSAWRFRTKLGAFYPPVSLENTGIGWTSPYTLSYSAINSWVGEELRGFAAEASVIRNGELHDVSAVASLTAANDRAGTLLYRRGWALHDFKPGMNDTYPLPPRPWAPAAEPELETPFLEIDEHPGYYAGLNWRYDKRYSLHALHFDNRADPASRESGEAGWLTRFDSLGMQLEFDHGITVLAQYMTGDTLIDIGTRDIVLDYQAAYLLASKVLGKHRFTLRNDWFDTVHRDASYGSDLSEDGTAVTFAYSYALTEKQRLFVELMQIDSLRESRDAIGREEDVRDRQIQIGWRLFFG